MAKLRIKADKELTELERFGFEKYKKEKPTWRSLWSKDKEKYIDEKYIEIGYIIDDGCNEITIVEVERIMIGTLLINQERYGLTNAIMKWVFLCGLMEWYLT